MKPKIRLSALLSLIIFICGACSINAPSGEGGDGKISAVATFYPLAEFTRQVGGDRVNITTVISAGTEPHDFEPTPRNIAAIDSSKIFIYNGNNLDPWADKIAAGLSQTTVVDMSLALGNAGADPHFWLDPVIALKEVEIIASALSASDPSGVDTYKRNAAAYAQKLVALDTIYKEKLATCATREIFTSHAAFAYLAARYNLIQSSIAGLSPDSEPSARQLAGLADSATAKNIKYIFFETLASPKLADTLAQATGAKTLVLNPLEGLTADDVKSGRDYISVMEDNLANLALALNCT